MLLYSNSNTLLKIRAIASVRVYLVRTRRIATAGSVIKIKNSYTFLKVCMFIIFSVIAKGFFSFLLIREIINS